MSKFLSLVLRHEPQRIGLILDAEGWANVEALLSGFAKDGSPISLSDLEEIVSTDNKQRYSLSDDRKRIRANQGHSIDVSLGYASTAPPDRLYHGTATRFLTAIRGQGLLKMERHHVHLSADEATANSVGRRHGKPAILAIRAGAMHQAGFQFFVSENGVWLVDHVPVEYLVFPIGMGNSA